MLKDSRNQTDEDPFSLLFQEGIEQFVVCEKVMMQDYKSKAQRNQEKIQRLKKLTNSPQQKKLKRQRQKQMEKNKVNQMSHNEARTYLNNIKKEKLSLKNKVRDAMDHGQVIILDLVYEQKMNEKENWSLAKQIQLIMTAIKHFVQPPSIHLCSFSGKFQQEMQRRNYQYWALTPHSQNVIQIGQKLHKKLIYLSPDASQPLESIDKDTAYILGGLIDRTVLKNASLRRAEELGIEARRLPISQFMTGRLCLNLDHVVKMICSFTETKNWMEAFDYAAPKRWKKDQSKSQNIQTKLQKQQQGSDAEQIIQKRIPHKDLYISSKKQQFQKSPPQVIPTSSSIFLHPQDNVSD